MIPMDALVFYGVVAAIVLAALAWDDARAARDRDLYQRWMDERVLKAAEEYAARKRK